MALLVVNSAVALAGAGALATVVRSGLLDPTAQTVPKATLRSRLDPGPSEKRFAFLPMGTLLELSPAPGALEAPPLKPTVSTSAASTAWSLEVRPETTAPATAKPSTEPLVRNAKQKARRGIHTLRSRLAEISPTASNRLAAKFAAAHAVWPPTEVALIAIKDEKAIELYARDDSSGWKRVHRYRVLAASGTAGPKLRQGDRQVPEGVYGIAALNPNSAYHVSLRVNYPNAFDQKMAAQDGRSELGGDIMIHGKNLSAGCLAIGDEAAEEVFVLAAKTGRSKVKLIIVPTDFRQNGVPEIAPDRPKWLPNLYAELASAMSEFKAPQRPPMSLGLLSFFSK